MKVQKLTDKIITIDDFIPRDACKEYIDLSENIGYETAKKEPGSGGQIIRNHNRAIHKSERLAEMLWEKAKLFAPERIGNSLAMGLNEMFRFYKYEPGQDYKVHTDLSYIRNSTEASYFTFVLYLNDDFEGGETVFSELSVKPKQGSALIFLHSVLHSGQATTKGTKYVLRTDVMYKLVEAEQPITYLT